jgi:PAS domain S-box-containing protein
MSEISKKIILLVEDDSYTAKIISIALEQSDLDVIIADSGEKAIEIINSGQIIHLILMDIILGDGIDGIEAARIILQDHDIPIMFLSGHSDPEILHRAEQVSSYGYLLKQSDYNLIITSIKMALNLYEARQKVRQHEETLKKREWFENIISESVSDGVVVIDETGTILFVNQTLEHIFGYSAEKMIGNKLTMLMPEYLRDRHTAAFSRYVKTKEKRLPCWTGISLPGLLKEGYEISLEVSWSENNSYGQRVFCGIIKDVTERIQTQEKLRKSEEAFRAMFANNPIPMLVYEPKTLRILEVNAMAIEHYGYSRDEFLAMTIAEMRPPEDIPKLLKQLAKIGKGTNRTGAWRHRKKDGTIIDVEITSHSIDYFGKDARLVIANDITERKKAADTIKQQNEFLHTVINSLEHHFYVVNTNSYIVEIANKATHPNLPKNMTCYELIHHLNVPCQNLGNSCTAEEVKLTKKPAITEHVHYHADGDSFFTEVRSYPIFDENGNVNKVIEYCVDITERKRKDEELRVSLQKYKVLFDSFPIGIAIKDSSDNFLESNKKFEEFLNVSEGKVGGKESHVIRPDGSRMPPEEYACARVLKEKRVIENVEMGIVQDDGSTRWVSVTAAPLLINGYGAVITYSDITERKEAEIALHKLTEELERRIAERSAEVHDLYNNAPCGYHSLDKNGVFLHINDTELNWLGYTRDELIGKKAVADMLTEKSHITFRNIFPIFKERGWVKGVEYELIRKDGSVLPVILNSTAIIDSEGNYFSSRSTLFDITERKKAEQAIARKSEELILANVALEKAARLKDEFLASMSHELRTPLTGVMSLSEALQEQVYGPLNEKQLKVVSRIEESGQHLLDLINDILDLSKVEAGQMTLQIEKTSVTDICQAALHLIRGMANKKHHNISFSANPPSMSINADPRRLKQMLLNLLSNAVKFTPDGGQIGLNVSGNAEEHYVDFTVSDNGIGIASEMFPMLFRPFVQLDSRLSRQYSGTGLGLSLIQRMAELHGGSITLESELGQGSKFTIRLPFNSAQILTHPTDNASAEKSEEEHPETLILLAEDNDANVRIYSEYLRIKGYRVAAAKNGNEAVQKVRSLQPKLILMDVQMPGMDGLEAIQIIRSDKNPRVASTPIIALTSLAMPGDQERCLSLGVKEYLSKPVSLKYLTELIEKNLKK